MIADDTAVPVRDVLEHDVEPERFLGRDACRVVHFDDLDLPRSQRTDDVELDTVRPRSCPEPVVLCDYLRTVGPFPHPLDVEAEYHFFFLGVGWIDQLRCLRSLLLDPFVSVVDVALYSCPELSIHDWKLVTGSDTHESTTPECRRRILDYVSKLSPPRHRVGLQNLRFGLWRRCRCLGGCRRPCWRRRLHGRDRRCCRLRRPGRCRVGTVPGLSPHTSSTHQRAYRRDVPSASHTPG